MSWKQPPLVTKGPVYIIYMCACFYGGSVVKNLPEIKNTLEATNSGITEAEDRISEVEDRNVEISESERKKEK